MASFQEVWSCFMWMPGGTEAAKWDVWGWSSDQVLWQIGSALSNASQASSWQP